ncbi:hypothetical protein NQ314_020519 [Rhamnusium bicolor]|uniref:PiggyBac transposable element-derived protein domain-containing protein n=1 Tax=Rhamnusium bicolor TaxID=1586634 RepID=A0AAV8WKU5_9CUCU|nr:hypothetical protein NQ314_020519 [Rhamnusium bicolor]
MYSYEEDQKRMLKLWQELETDEQVGGPAEDDVHEEKTSDHDSHSEQSEDEESSIDIEQNLYTHLCFLGKDKKTLWSKIPVIMSGTKTRSHNIVTQSSGVIGAAKGAKTILEAWQLYFPDSVLEEIVQCTNKYIQKLRANYTRVRDTADTDVCETKAVLGLLYLADVLRSLHLNLRDLWAQNGTVVEYFRLTMGLNRFQFFLRALRFDDIDAREFRRQFDKLAPIRHYHEQAVDGLLL